MAETPADLQVSGRQRDPGGSTVGDGWVSLSCSIDNYSPDMSVAEVDQSIERALEVWAAVTPLSFTKVSGGPADIRVSFGQQCEYEVGRLRPPPVVWSAPVSLGSADTLSFFPISPWRFVPL